MPTRRNKLEVHLNNGTVAAGASVLSLEINHANSAVFLFTTLLSYCPLCYFSFSEGFDCDAF